MPMNIETNVYNKIKDNISKQLLDDFGNEELKALYIEFTKDFNLEELKNKIVEREVSEFLSTIHEAKNSKLSIEDYGFDCDRYYIRFWAEGMDVLNIHYEKIIEFLQNVADRTQLIISPEFNVWKELKPTTTVAREEVKIVSPPKIFCGTNMEVELN